MGTKFQEETLLAMGGCLKQLTFNYGEAAIIKGQSHCNMFLRTKFFTSS